MRIAFTILFFCWFTQAQAQTMVTDAEKGYQLLTQKSFVKPIWTVKGFESVWNQWGEKKKPEEFLNQLMDRYGLYTAPYENNGLPMGLRRDRILLVNGITIDCMVCHGGSIFGKSYIGLGNSTLELHGLFEEITKSDNTGATLSMQFSRVRGTNEAGAIAVLLLGYRDKNLNLQTSHENLGLQDDLCEDVPAWWLLKKKKTMYFTGGADAKSVRSKMQFMMSPLNGLDAFESAESDFKYIQKYIESIEAPKYPEKIDWSLAQAGKKIFTTNCAECHGNYDKGEESYPNVIVPLDIIGTDRKRYDGISEAFGRKYNQSWFAKERMGWFYDDYPSQFTDGYQAPPLDGIWATAPYFHNGSVPTLEAVLDSSQRPKVFTRSFKTNREDYDFQKVGWKVKEMDAIPTNLSTIESRKFYDTRITGRGNQGHRFGDKLQPTDRRALVEYLKTL